MLAYLKKFVKRLKPLLNPPLEKGRRYGISFYLVLANILLVFFLILLSNVGVLPFENIEDFGFFAVIFLILALYRPGWSFLFFIGTIALENINLAPESLGIAVRPYQFIGALTILAVLIRLASKRLNFSLPKISWQDKAVMVFAAAGFVSILGAADKNLSLKYSVIILSFAALYFLTRLFIQNLEDVKKILPFFLSSSIVIILYGIWQNVRFMKGLSNFEAMPGRPNATFMEADWLGMYLVLVLAVIYSLIFYFCRTGDNQKSKIFNFQFSITKFLNSFLYLLLTACYIILILTVSRSAWLGAIVVSIMYLVVCIMYFLRSSNKKILWIPACAGMTFIVAFGIIAIFNLTSFELGNRLQSTGTKLQEITVACKNNLQLTTDNSQRLPEIIKDVSELQQYNCYHINLEEIEKEKLAGNIIATVYRGDPNVNIRSEIYHKSWEEIKKHSILGIGRGNISQVLGTDERGAGLNSSNIFLEVWLGSGLLGLTAFLFIVLHIFLQSVWNLWKGIMNQESGIMVFNLFILLSFFAILIPNLFNAGIMLGFLWIWLAIAQIKQSNNETI